jgi:hypothetical protein
MPNAGFVGSDSFQYEALDPSNASSGPVTVAILVVNSHPWQNRVNRLDVNGDGFVSPIDALQVINRLNDPNWDPLPPPSGTQPPPFVDVDGSGAIEPLDALLVINQLNAEAEGESVASGWSNPAYILSDTRPTSVTPGAALRQAVIREALFADLDGRLAGATGSTAAQYAATPLPAALDAQLEELLPTLADGMPQRSPDGLEGLMANPFGDL